MNNLIRGIPRVYGYLDDIPSLKYTKKGWPEKNPLHRNSIGFYRKRLELHVEKDVLFWGPRLIIHVMTTQSITLTTRRTSWYNMNKSPELLLKTPMDVGI